MGCLVALLILTGISPAQVTVSDDLQNLGLEANSNQKVWFELKNCNDNQPIAGGKLISSKAASFTVDSAGHFSGTLAAGNDVINCGGVTGYTRYDFWITQSNTIVYPRMSCNVTGSTFHPATGSCIQGDPPTLPDEYCKLGGPCVYTGTHDFTGANVLGINGGPGGGAPTTASYITAQAESGLSNETLWSAMLGLGALASRPASDSTKPGKLYCTNDTGQMRCTRDSGSAWVDLYWSWNWIEGKPSTFAPSAHAHPESEVTNLVSDLAAKEATANKGAANGYAGLDGSSLVPLVNLPSYPESKVTNLVSDLATKPVKPSGDCHNATTDKVIYDQTSNQLTCATDQTGAPGSGISSLNGLTAATQTMDSVNDTNVTLAISQSSSSNNRFTVGFTGTLAKARQFSATVYNDQPNTFGNFLQQFQAGTNFRLVDPTDTTKKLNFDLSSISTASLRQVKLPDSDMYICPNGTLDGQVCIWDQANARYAPGDPIISPDQAAATSQSITATGALTAIDVTRHPLVLVTIRGTYAGIGSTFEASPDATNYFTAQAVRVDSAAIETATGTLTNTTRAWFVNTSGMTRFRLNVSAYTSGTGSVTITPLGMTSGPVTVQVANGVSIKDASGVNQQGQRSMANSIPVAIANDQSALATSVADGQNATVGAKADARSTATDSTAITIMQVLKQISFMLQSPATTPMSAASLPLPSNAAQETGGNLATLAGIVSAAKAAVKSADGDFATLGAKGDAKSSATDTTAITAMQVLKQISFMLQNPAQTPTNTAQIGGNAVVTPDNGVQGVAALPTTSSTAAVSDCIVASAASTNATSCKGSAGNFYGYEVYNTTTTTYYLRLYNSSTAPTCSSATGFVRSIPIPPAGAAGGANGALSNQVFPTNYSTGIGFCITGGSANTDNTNAATGLFVTVHYK